MSSLAQLRHLLFNDVLRETKGKKLLVLGVLSALVVDLLAHEVIVRIELFLILVPELAVVARGIQRNGRFHFSHF